MRHQVSSPTNCNNSNPPWKSYPVHRVSQHLWDLQSSHRTYSQGPQSPVVMWTPLISKLTSTLCQSLSNLWWPGGSLLPMNLLRLFHDIGISGILQVGRPGNSFHWVTGPRTQTITKLSSFLRRTVHSFSKISVIPCHFWSFVGFDLESKIKEFQLSKDSLGFGWFHPTLPMSINSTASPAWEVPIWKKPSHLGNFTDIIDIL